MKKYRLVFRLVTILIIMIRLAGSVNSQGINGVAVFPAAPTTTDSIKVVASTWLPSAPCWVQQTSIYMLGQDIYIDAHYDVGMLMVICSSTDTFRMGPLAPGNYIGHFNLIYPWPTNNVAATMNFNVNVGGTTGLPQSNNLSMMKTWPNPAFDQLEVAYKVAPGEEATELQIYSVQGIKMSSLILTRHEAGKVSIPLNCPAGNYFLVLRSKNKMLTRNLFTIIR